MSSRFGISDPRHHASELVEEVSSIVGTCGRLGVVLHAEGRRIEAAQALHDIVVEADMADLNPSVRRVSDLADRRIDGESVVMGGHRDATRGQVLDRLVDPAVSEAQLVGAEAEGPTEHLMAEAIPNTGRPRPVRRAQGRPHAQPPPGRRALEKNTPSRPRSSISSALTSAGTTWTVMPRSAMRCGVIDLMPGHGGDDEALLSEGGTT